MRDRGLFLAIFIAMQGIMGQPRRLTDAYFTVAKALSEQRKIHVITREDLKVLPSESDLVRRLKEKLSDLFLTKTSF